MSVKVGAPVRHLGPPGEGTLRDLSRPGRHAFSLPVLDVPLFDREVVGVDMLRRMGEAIFGDRDPAAVLHAGGRQQVVETEGGFALRVPLPVPSGTIQLNRTASDELIVHIGNRRRILSLPHTLAAMTIRGARHQDNTLHVDFAPAGAD